MTDQADSTRAGDEAAQWFARLSRTSVTTEELKAFRAWRQDPAHARAYRRLEDTWAATAELAHDPQIADLTRRTLARRTRPTLRKRRRAWAALAAGALGSGLAVAAIIWMDPSETYRTRTGEQRLLVLADGSRVRLNTDSRLTVRLGRAERRLTLAKGEAFFEAAHDPSRPFVVTAGQAQVRAIGTRFDVRRDADAIRVTLVEGRVQVRRAEAPAGQVLTPNQTLMVTGAGVSPPRATDAQADAGWTSGRLTFRDLPLREAVAEVNRYSDNKVILDVSADLAAKPVSGVFDVGDTGAFAQAAGSEFDLVARPDPKGVRLAARAPAAAPP